MKKRILSFITALFVVLSVSTVAFAQGEETQDMQNEDFLIQCQGTDEYESITAGSDCWYENLPLYDGKTISTSIEPESLLQRKANAQDATKSVASIQTERVSASEGRFRYWKNAALTLPVGIYSLDDTLYAHAYGIVDQKDKLVGYIVVGIGENASPVMEYSYDPYRFLEMERAKKLYFSSETGILLQESNEELSCISGGDTLSMADAKAMENTPAAKAFAKESAQASKAQWTQYAEYAAIAMKSAKSGTETGDAQDAERAEKAETPVLRAAATQKRLSMDTSDYEWLTLCSYTSMSMYFDAIGRRIEPALMGTARPHSIRLNKTLHTEYGHKPTNPEIATHLLNWANKRKLSSALTFSKYYEDGALSTCFARHKAQINKNIPTLVAYDRYSPEDKKMHGHIMMGIGYTSNDYYIVRDTWTMDGKPINSAEYIYNKMNYRFIVLGLNYSNSNSATGWGSVTLKEGASNFNVRRLKIMLYLLFYEPGSLTTNTFDAKTTAAVKAFQKDNGLTADGVVGSGTYKKLITAHIMRYDGNTANWRVLKKGKKGDDVAQLQLRLFRMKYLPGTATCDGVFGDSTEAALKKFQAAKGITADGIAGSATLAKVYGINHGVTNPPEYQRCYTCSPDEDKK